MKGHKSLYVKKRTNNSNLFPHFFLTQFTAELCFRMFLGSQNDKKIYISLIVLKPHCKKHCSYLCLISAHLAQHLSVCLSVCLFLSFSLALSLSLSVSSPSVFLPVVPVHHSSHYTSEYKQGSVIFTTGFPTGECVCDSPPQSLEWITLLERPCCNITFSAIRCACTVCAKQLVEDVWVICIREMKAADPPGSHRGELTQKRLCIP